MRLCRIGSIAAVAAALCIAPEVRAQQQPQPGPPPGFEPQAQPPPATPGAQPPPGYGYPPPPGYGYPPPAVPSGPKTLPYEDGDPVPQGYRVETSSRKGLIIGGAVTFGVFYLLSVMTGALAQAIDKADGGSGDEWVPMYIPVVGPFVTIGTAKAKNAGIVSLAVLGVAQTGGATMFVLGFVLPKTELVRNDIGGSLPRGTFALTPRTSPVQVGVLPAAPHGSTGLTLVGSM